MSEQQTQADTPPIQNNPPNPWLPPPPGPPPNRPLPALPPYAANLEQRSSLIGTLVFSSDPRNHQDIEEIPARYFEMPDWVDGTGPDPENFASVMSFSSEILADGTVRRSNILVRYENTAIESEIRVVNVAELDNSIRSYHNACMQAEIAAWVRGNHPQPWLSTRAITLILIVEPGQVGLLAGLDDFRPQAGPQAVWPGNEAEAQVAYHPEPAGFPHGNNPLPDWPPFPLWNQGGHQQNQQRNLNQHHHQRRGRQQYRRPYQYRHYQQSHRHHHPYH